MTKTIYVGKKKFKKAYSVTIREREVNKNGKTTPNSINSTSFQIKDVNGSSDLLSIRKKLMEGLEK